MNARRWLAGLGLLLGGLLGGLVGAARAEAPPQAGSFAPDFTLPDAGGREWRLADWRGKWLVLYFYPKDDTPGCTTEAIAFRDGRPRLAELKAEVVGISLDDAPSHRAFAEKHRLPFTLLADKDGVVATRYGALRNLGIVRFAKRYTFLIDPDGRVAKSYLNVEPDRHLEQIIADLKMLR
jgi:peroxiredoxin Q/BCP